MRVASIFAILRPFEARQTERVQFVAAAAFSGLFWPLWSVLALAQRQSAKSRPLPRFRAIFAAQEHFIFQAALSPNCNAIRTFGPFYRCQGTLSLQQFKGCRSQPLPPPKRFRRLRRRLSASRSFALASRPNRAEPPFLQRRTLASPHIRQSADLFRHSSPNRRFLKNDKRAKRHCQQKLALVHASTRFFGGMATPCAAAKPSPMHERGRSSASISTTIGARSKSFRPTAQKQAASVPRADRTTSIHRATSRQRQRHIRRWRHRSATVKLQKRALASAAPIGATQASRSGRAFCQ